ncbi:AAA family ATPase [Roseovarius sp. S4756]|uniref:AAA family ATPase n=1 Tax=Roseovarius maritimus TaxID=3342637 RepID=UPI0037294FAF
MVQRDLCRRATFDHRQRVMLRAPATVNGAHVAALLNAEVSIVLDFPANTVEQRNWVRGILETTCAPHQLHLLAVSNEVGMARLRDRNRQGDHPFAVSEAQFHQLSSHFVSPSPDEGFDIVRHESGA